MFSASLLSLSPAFSDVSQRRLWLLSLLLLVAVRTPVQVLSVVQEEE
jgi:hypothetical protein